jgi:hypothetical protein
VHQQPRALFSEPQAASEVNQTLADEYRLPRHFSVAQGFRNTLFLFRHLVPTYGCASFVARVRDVELVESTSRRTIYARTLVHARLP